MDFSRLCADLSSVVPSDRTRRAAEQLLSTEDPGATLSRVYHFLVWHRTLRTALWHLEDRGADLDHLVVSLRQFQDTFPKGYRAIWNMDHPGPVTGRFLIELYARHRRLLAEPILGLLDEGVEGFVLVSGRAYEARYPEYATRVEFDTDAVVPDFAAASRVTHALEEHGYRLDTVHVTRTHPKPEGVVEVRAVREGHLVSIGLLVGGYHAHRGPIIADADSVQWRGRKVLAASPEHLLLMVAARIDRKGVFALGNVNDAAMVMRSAGSGLDWGFVGGLARAQGLAATLLAVVRQATALLQWDLRRDVAASLTPSRVSRFAVRRVGEAVAEADLTFRSEPDASNRRLRPQRRPDAPTALTSIESLRKRLWKVTRRYKNPAAALSAALLRLQRMILTRLLRRVRDEERITTRDLWLNRIRTRTGFLCEVAPHLAAGQPCISLRVPFCGSDTIRIALARVGAGYHDTTTIHDCSRFRFDLAVTHGVER